MRMRGVATGIVLVLTACGAGSGTPGSTARSIGTQPGGLSFAGVGSTDTRLSVDFFDARASFAIGRADAARAVSPAGITPTGPAIDLDVTLDLPAIGSLEDAIRADQAKLPQPNWWSGSCNANRSRGAYPLGASFRGVAACGPQPGKSDGRLVRFFPTAWGEYEWQCTELVYRFMYLAYGIVPYNGNGDQVVDNYRPAYGGWMVKVTNGSGELPVPGDVLSFLSVHTAIVTGVHVDTQGNGSIDILEQNAAGNGSAKLAVNGFRIARVKNWLHHLVG